MADKSRLQVKTTANPEKWEDVGAGSVGVPIPVSVEGGNITIDASDIEIGAIEIKDHDSDTRANVSANGLEVDVKAMPSVTVGNMIPAVETGLATSAKQDSQVALEAALNSLIGTLQETTQRLSALSSVVSNNATMRISGAVTATGGGYQTSAQFIAAFLTSKIALENMNAVNSNVNNCVGV